MLPRLQDITETHHSLVELCEHGAFRSPQYVNPRVEYARNLAYRDDVSYSCIITLSTKRYKSVREFFKEFGFVEVGSAIGNHGEKLYLYFRKRKNAPLQDNRDLQPSS